MPWPSQASQRPPLVLNGKAARAPAAHARFVRLGEQAPDRVPEADVGRGQERGVLPIGVWSTSSTRPTLSAPRIARQPNSGASFFFLCSPTIALESFA